jgi:hypothetical protein
MAQFNSPLHGRAAANRRRGRSESFRAVASCGMFRP